MKPEEHDLLVRSLDAVLSGEEQRGLALLLETSPEAQAEAEAFQAVRRAVQEQRRDSFGPYFADRVVRRLREQPTQRRLSAAWLVPAGAMRWAMVAVFVVMAAGFAWWALPQTASAPYGGTTVVHFADGSVVTLASGARLHYRRFLGRPERRVTLQGEAFFEVAPQEKLFVVETFNADVTVKGTRFNVRAWPDDLTRETVVSLESGLVEVAARTAVSARTASLEAQPVVVLAPGETARVVAGKGAAGPPELVSMDRVLAWRKGGLAFVEQPLADVAKALERRFNVEIALQSPAVGARPVTYLNPKPSTLTDVLDDVCFSLNLQYRPVAGGFVIQQR